MREPIWITTSTEKKEDSKTIVEKLVDIHPYDLLEIMVMPLEAGNREYPQWMERESGSNGQSRKTDIAKKRR